VRTGLSGLSRVDRAGHEAFATAFYAAFDGLHHTIETVFADDDHAAVRFLLSGTHTGIFLGVPASGRSVASWRT
jgi:predicted ester cyclase